EMGGDHGDEDAAGRCFHDGDRALAEIAVAERQIAEGARHVGGRRHGENRKKIPEVDHARRAALLPADMNHAAARPDTAPAATYQPPGAIRYVPAAKTRLTSQGSAGRRPRHMPRSSTRI